MRVERVPIVLPGMPTIAYVGAEGDVALGSGGLSWLTLSDETVSRCWIWLDVIGGAKCEHPITVVRWARRLLKTAVQLGETEVLTGRDQNEAMSEKLLALLGFEFLRELDGVRIYKWQLSR